MTDFKYFDVEKIASRNALMSFIISSRGAGKTYSAKQRILRRFNRHGELFLFLKRTETEFEATRDNFWDDFVTEKRRFRFHKGRFEIGDREVDRDDEGNEVEEITWRTLGYGVALSTISKLKGISIQNVGTVLWDEFVPYDGRYLRDESDRLMDVLETVGRMRDDVRLIALGNKNEDGYYPIFRQLKLPISSNFEDDKIYSFKGGEVVIYSFTNRAYVEAKKKTKLGKVARGTEFFEKMYDNKNVSNFSQLVIQKPKRYTKIFSIAINGKFYNVGYALVNKSERGLYFEETNEPGKYLYTCDKSIPTLPKIDGKALNLMYGYVTSGYARFDAQTTAQDVINVITGVRR